MTTNNDDLNYHADGVDDRLQLVDFAKATPEHLQALCQSALQHAQTILDEIQQLNVSTISADDALSHILRFNDAFQAIERYFGLISHLNSVKNDEHIRDVHHTLLPVLTQFNTHALQSSALYGLHKKALTALNDNSARTKQQSVAIKQALLSFELSGVGLNPQDQQRFGEIQSQLSTLSAKFSDNVLDATHEYYLPLSKEDTAGMTEGGIRLLTNAKAQKQANDIVINSDYIATLDLPTYLAVMQYADNRQVRQTLYKAYVTRASTEANADFDNSDIMRQILSLRAQKAQILHKKLPHIQDYTDISLAPKMAQNADEVMDFLYQLSRHAKPVAAQEFDEIKALGKTLGIDEVQAWDIAYLSEKLRLQKYALDSDALRVYFPANQVLTGLFEICRHLFDIQFVKKQVPTWHDDVLFYEVYDSNTHQLLGALYLDLYTRANKRGGAWLSSFQNRDEKAKTVLPVGFIVCNFTPPIDDKPALLSFDEVLTLFHEFGHGLHHLLTEVLVDQIAGINGVEWDAVELPSQFLENFATDKQGILKISRHIDTDEPLPDEMLSAILNSKHFQSGMATIRQLEFAIFDMLVHREPIQSYEELLAVMADVRAQIGVVPTPAYNRFANSFNHIFSGGYASGYYSYKWAELLSADAFAKFEENGVFDKATGLSFRQEILAKGSSRSARDNFIAFRGRAPNIDALLRHSGFLSAQSA